MEAASENKLQGVIPKTTLSEFHRLGELLDIGAVRELYLMISTSAIDYIYIYNFIRSILSEFGPGRAPSA